MLAPGGASVRHDRAAVQPGHADAQLPGAGRRRRGRRRARAAVPPQGRRRSNPSSSTPRSTPPISSNSRAEQCERGRSSASRRKSPRSKRWSIRAPRSCSRIGRGRARRHAGDPAARGAAGAVRLEPEPRRAGARHGVLGHRGGLRCGAQSDPRQGQPGPARADAPTIWASRTAAARIFLSLSAHARGAGAARPGSVAAVARPHQPALRCKRWTDPVQLLIDAGAIPSTPFGPDSRYAASRSAATRCAAGDPGVRYVLRRFVPQPREIPLATRTSCAPATAPDLLAAHYLGDAELYWRIADANARDRPAGADRRRSGERLAIPLPPGTGG